MTTPTQAPRSSIRLSALVLIGAAGLLCACVTPDTRIKDNPEAFARLTPDQQALIKLGQVAIGFDETAVKLALGDPDRITERTDEKGKSIVWTYIQYDTDAGVPLYRGYYHYYYAPLTPYYLDYPTRVEHERERIVFTDGKVGSIEREIK